MAANTFPSDIWEKELNNAEEKLSEAFLSVRELKRLFYLSKSDPSYSDTFPIRSDSHPMTIPPPVSNFPQNISSLAWNFQQIVSPSMPSFPPCIPPTVGPNISGNFYSSTPRLSSSAPFSPENISTVASMCPPYVTSSSVSSPPTTIVTLSPSPVTTDSRNLSVKASSASNISFPSIPSNFYGPPNNVSAFLPTNSSEDMFVSSNKLELDPVAPLPSRYLPTERWGGNEISNGNEWEEEKVLPTKKTTLTIPFPLPVEPYDLSVYWTEPTFDVLLHRSGKVKKYIMKMNGHVFYLHPYYVEEAPRPMDPDQIEIFCRGCYICMNLAHSKFEHEKELDPDFKIMAGILICFGCGRIGYHPAVCPSPKCSHRRTRQ